MEYKHRYLQDYLAIRPRNFRAVLITGPRRSGKSTFAKELLKEWGGGDYVQFDTPADQVRFLDDPEGMIRALSKPAVLDEVQNIPEIFNYLKKVIDEDPDGICNYILTGSQQFHMMRGITESLAGRVMVKELLPFSYAESRKAPSGIIRENFLKLLDLSSDLTVSNDSFTRSDALEAIVMGGYPSVAQATNAQEREEWFNSYLETYVQRDIRALSNIQNLAQFSRFVQLVAGRTATIINYSELGKDIGVNYKTAQHYLSLLSASYIWKSLPPYYQAGSERRVTKSPKGVFLDTGLAVYLTGVSPSGLERSQLYGSMFESFVITELLKLTSAFGKRVNFTHFRMGERAEVDLVLEYGNRIIPVEIKGSSTIDSKWGKGIKALRDVTGAGQDCAGYVVSLHPHVVSLGSGVLNVPIQCFL